MVDAVDLKSIDLAVVRVQVPPRALFLLVFTPTVFCCVLLLVTLSINPAIK